MEHFSIAEHETGRNLIKTSTNLGFIDSKITCLFGPEMMDILCGCISHHRRFPSSLGRFAGPLHNTTQT